MTFSKDSSAGYLVNDLARRFAAALQARIKPIGLSTGVFPVMVQLWEDDGLTQTELVEHTVAVTADGLEVLTLRQGETARA